MSLTEVLKEEIDLGLSGTMYHFTHYHNVYEIEKSGLKPNKNLAYKNGCDGVFLTLAKFPEDTNLSAHLWDEYEQSYLDNGEIDYETMVRITVDISKLNNNKFYPDDDYVKLNNINKQNIEKNLLKHLKKSLWNTKTLCYTETILPKYFKDIHIITGYKELRKYDPKID